MKFYTNISRFGNSILVREITSTGPEMRVVKYEPTLYMSGSTSSEMRSLSDEPVVSKKFKSIADAKKFVEEYSGIQSVKLHGLTDWLRAFTNEYYPGAIEYDFGLLKVYSLDIETRIKVDENGNPAGFPSVEEGDCQVTLISMQNIITKKIVTFGIRPYTGTRKDVEYHNFNGDEDAMLRAFALFMAETKPDILTGWNIEGFDIPYLIARIGGVCGADTLKMLSPWKKTERRVTMFQGKKQFRCDIQGVELLDYMLLYKKFVLKKQESYSLDNISKVELGHSKLDHSEWDNFNAFMDGDWNKFVDYNIIDVELVTKLEAKKKLIQLAAWMSYRFKINYSGVFGPVKMWDSIIHNTLLESNIVVPMHQDDDDSEEDDGVEGAYVKEPVPGMYEWVTSIDSQSMYPSNMIVLNISPDTYVGTRPDVTFEEVLAGKCFVDDPDLCLSPVGAQFIKDKPGIIPKLISGFMSDRKKAKGEMLRLEGEVEKIKSVLATRA